MKILLKSYSILLLLFTLSSCNKTTDPFQNTLLGKIDYTTLKEQLLKDNILKEIKDDTISFSSHVASYPVKVIINPDRYFFGKARQIEIHLNSLPGGPRKKEEVDKIYEKYLQWYGAPDSVVIPPWEINPITGLPIESFKKRTITYWNTDNFQLTFFISEAESKSKSTIPNYYNSAFISYQMLNYQSHLKLIQDSIKVIKAYKSDSIRKSYKPKDLAGLEIWNCQWSKITHDIYDYQLKFEARHLTRKGREEPKSVTAVRYDVVFTDEFNEELARIENLTETADKPMETPSNGEDIWMGYNTYKYKYSINSSIGRKLEKARTYQNTLKAIADIKAVAFEDGSVLKEN